MALPVLPFELHPHSWLAQQLHEAAVSALTISEISQVESPVQAVPTRSRSLHWSVQKRGVASVSHLNATGRPARIVLVADLRTINAAVGRQHGGARDVQRASDTARRVRQQGRGGGTGGGGA